jgi:hypothetical protein
VPDTLAPSAPLFSPRARAPACPNSGLPCAATRPSQAARRRPVRHRHHRFIATAASQSKPMPPEVSSCRAEHAAPFSVAGDPPERRRPWEPEPAAMPVRRRPSLCPPPSKVSSPTCSPLSPPHFPLLTRAPRPPGRRRRNPRPPTPPPPCSCLCPELEEALGSFAD